MLDPTEMDDSKITVNDWALAGAYYPILVDLAKQQKTVTYGELISIAKTTYPERREVQRAIAISTGRALGVMRKYTREIHPDLACLVVNKSKMECGKGYSKFFDGEAERKKIAAFKSWNEVLSSFDGFKDKQPVMTRYIRATKASAVGTVNKKEATERMAAYFTMNRATLPISVKDHREFIVGLIMKGSSEEQAFAEAVKRIATT
jgi:hypothetical protein